MVQVLYSATLKSCCCCSGIDSERSGKFVGGLTPMYASSLAMALNVHLVTMAGRVFCREAGEL